MYALASSLSTKSSVPPPFCPSAGICVSAHSLNSGMASSTREEIGEVLDLLDEALNRLCALTFDLLVPPEL